MNRCCLVLLCALVAIQLAHAADKPNLLGQVTDQHGAGLEGATVFVYSAGPRVGRSMFCPTCYADCRKSDVSGREGSFRIEALNPDLIFRLLVVNKGYKPLFVPKTDPLKSPVTIKLEPRNEEKIPSRFLAGRILDPEGEPIKHAVVEFAMFLGEEANCGGQCDGVDLVAVTDADGRFFLASEKKFDTMDIRVEAPGYARKKFFRLASGGGHDLKLNEGATVTGRVVRDGKPVPDVAVGLVSMDRSDNFTGNYDTFTDDEGHFSFQNVPPYQMYYAYSLMGKAPDGLVTPVVKVRVAADGSRRELGDLPLTSGVRLRGRVVLADGKAVPATQVIVGRGAAWDSQSVLLDANGRFDVTVVRGESISVSLSVPGYRFAESNESLDQLNGGALVGRVDENTDVTILLEPGDFQRPDFSKRRLTPDMQPTDKPLRGAPSGTL